MHRQAGNRAGRRMDAGFRIGGGGRHRLRVRARRGAGRGDLHRPGRQLSQPAVRREPEPEPLHVRVGLSRASRFLPRRRAGLQRAPAHGRLPRREDQARAEGRQDRRGDADSRFLAPGRHAGGQQARRGVSRGLLQEPLRRPHLHHAGPGGAQEVGAPEAQCHEHRVQGQERADRRRLHRARHHLARDRPDGARCRREVGDLRLGRAAGEVPERLRDRHADAQRAGRARPLGRRGGQDHRRRLPDLPGRRRPAPRGARHQPGDPQLRGVLLRRQLHHRQRQRRVPRFAGARASGARLAARPGSERRVLALADEPAAVGRMSASAHRFALACYDAPCVDLIQLADVGQSPRNS
ncbi:hypothetical protein BGLA2_430060 [Burkholderia gladioli]|nr:hypothetical protein BGLA2_430060 [Burkholderia gladioli]